jgi:DNA-binding response OmpR family regulator
MRVLMVEDKRKMAEPLKEGLEEENHLVSVAFDGRAGLGFATSSDFDAIVLDLMLPGLDGLRSRAA